MWISGFALIPLRLIAFSSTLLGFLFLFIAWTDVASAQATNIKSEIPTALYAFTGSVLLDLLGLVFEIWREDVFQALLMGAFVLLVVSMVLVRRGSWPGRKDLKVGANALFGIAVLGLIWLFAG